MKCNLETGVHKGLRQQWGEILVKSIMMEKYLQGESYKAPGWDHWDREPKQRPGERRRGSLL